MKAQKNRKATKKIVHQGRFLRFVKRGSWEFVERHNCTAIVIIVAVTDDQKVVFTEQFRPPVFKNVIEFPAGLVNDSASAKEETINQAAKRELLEETGYKAKKIVELLVGPTSSGSSADLVTMVRAVGIQKVAQGGGDADEAITVHEVDLKNVDVWLDKMKRKGYLIEPKIYAGLYMLNKYNVQSKTQ